MVLSVTLNPSMISKYPRIRIDEQVCYTLFLKNVMTCWSIQRKLDQQFKTAVMECNISKAIKAIKNGSIYYLKTQEVIELMVKLEGMERFESLKFLIAQIRSFNQTRYVDPMSSGDVETDPGCKGPWEYVDPAAKGITKAYLILKSRKDPAADLLHRVYLLYRDDLYSPPKEMGQTPDSY